MRNGRKSTKRTIETYDSVSTNGRGMNKGATKPDAGSRLPWVTEMVPPHGLRPAPRNARTHSKKQIRQIADLISRFGFTNPVIADDHGQIVAGHAGRSRNPSRIEPDPDDPIVASQRDGDTCLHPGRQQACRKGRLGSRAIGRRAGGAPGCAAGNRSGHRHHRLRPRRGRCDPPGSCQGPG